MGRLTQLDSPDNLAATCLHFTASRLASVGSAPGVYGMMWEIRHELWVVIHAGDGDVIILEGPAEVVTDDAELHAVNAARAEKYVSQCTGACDTILIPATVVYRVTVRRVMAWESGNMASRAVWLFDHAPEGASGAQ